MSPRELLGPVDWNEWRRLAPSVQAIQTTQAIQTVELAHAVVIEGKAHAIGEAERVALLVLSLGRKQNSKAATKAVRLALREIEQAVLSCEQEIDYSVDEEE